MPEWRRRFKQHLAAIRQPFDYLVTGGFLPSVCGPFANSLFHRPPTPNRHTDQNRRLPITDPSTMSSSFSSLEDTKI